MHDVDVRLILIVHLIQNRLVFIKKLTYFKIHRMHKLKTNNGNSTRKKSLGSYDTKDSRTKEKHVCLRFVHYA